MVPNVTQNALEGSRAPMFEVSHLPNAVICIISKLAPHISVVYERAHQVCMVAVTPVEVKLYPQWHTMTIVFTGARAVAK